MIGIEAEAERPLVKESERVEAVSRRLFSVHVDRGLVDILLDLDHGIGKIDKRPARAVLEEYLRFHGIIGFGADGVEELLGLKPVSAYPDSAQAAILMTESTGGNSNSPYLVYQLPFHYHSCGDFPADSVCVIHVSGNFKLGENVYLSVLSMDRKRHKNYILSEPQFELSTYDISPDPGYDAKKEYERAEDRPVRLHTTRPRPNSVYAPVRCKRMVASYEMVIRFLDTLVINPRTAVSLINEAGVETFEDGFTIRIEEPLRDGLVKATRYSFPYRPREDGPSHELYRSTITHAERNGYGTIGKHAIIAALRHSEESCKTR